MSIDANPSVRINIRWSVQRDMEEMLEIEKESFGRFSWSRDDFMSVMRARNTIGLIAEIEEKVVGYIVYELSKTRLAILNLAVDKLYRHKSIGYRQRYRWSPSGEVHPPRRLRYRHAWFY